ncbi:MAG: phosphohistidine phosphatase SixA [Ignavibacteria bacterium RBG_16_34_14]|nr:MAG: phosphohistidine phosphatase SixA [Ignavibacteria bacterium RBG_16_34_14]
MNLYLIRHGDAEPISPTKSDHKRELTPKGKGSIRKAAEGWKKIIKSFDIIAASPLTRAVQTAEIIVEVFNYKEKVITDKRITSGAKFEDFKDFIKSFDEDVIAIVGHEPDMSRHLSALVSSSGSYVEFKKGSIAKIKFEGKVRASGGTLEFLIPSELFK